MLVGPFMLLVAVPALRMIFIGEDRQALPAGEEAPSEDFE
jgi:hypothetical protein